MSEAEKMVTEQAKEILKHLPADDRKLVEVYVDSTYVRGQVQGRNAVEREGYGFFLLAVFLGLALGFPACRGVGSWLSNEGDRGEYKLNLERLTKRCAERCLCECAEPLDAPYPPEPQP